MNTSNEMITLTLPENINDDIHLLVLAINLCGLESEASETITIPAEGIILTHTHTVTQCHIYVLV